jgi:myo-inositol-1(or 4)-monophosphatase
MSDMEHPTGRDSAAAPGALPAGRTLDDGSFQRLALAKAAAYDAGKILLKFWGRLSGYDRKGNLDLVSEADRASEQYLLERILGRFPADSVIGEESGTREGDSGYSWIVDPLDGTTNFVHGHPIFAVSIAVADRSGTQAGVIYLPTTRELFWGARGMGAWRNETRLSVSGTGELNDSLIATGHPYNRRQVVETILEDWRRMILHVQGVRRMGAAAVDLAFVAAGRFDGFWERGLKPWDTAAGQLLVEEAGGRVTGFSGQEYSPFNPDITASNGRIHDRLLDALFSGRPDAEGGR